MPCQDRNSISYIHYRVLNSVVVAKFTYTQSQVPGWF